MENGRSNQTLDRLKEEDISNTTVYRIESVNVTVGPEECDHRTTTKSIIEYKAVSCTHLITTPRLSDCSELAIQT